MIWPMKPMHRRLSLRVAQLNLLLGTQLLLASTALAQTAIATSAAPKIAGSVHFKNPDATIAAVKSYVPVNIKTQDAMKEVVGEMSKVVAMAAPVDVVAALDASAGEAPAPPLWGFAVGIASMDEAYKLAQTKGFITDGKSGLYRLGVPVGSRTTLFCWLGSTSGGQGRLACSNRERDRDVLGPYLLRVPASPAASASDVHVELQVAELVRTYQAPLQRVLQMGGMALPQRLQLGQPKFDRAVTDATQELVRQLAGMSHDLALLTLDGTLSNSGMQVQLGYQLSGTESWWGQAEAEANKRAPGVSGPPAVFWKLPSDVTAASYRTSDPKYAQRALQLLLPILDGWLEHDGMAPPDRQALVDLFLKVPKFDAPLTAVMAEGHSDVAAAKSTGKEPAKAPIESEVVAAMLGGSFYLLTSDASTAQSDQSVAFLRGLLAAYNRPGVQGYLKKKWKALGGTDPLPQLRSEPVKQLGAGATGMSLTLNLSSLQQLKQRAGLPSDKPAKAAPAKAAPVTIYIFSAPLGPTGQVWSAVGTDKATLLRRLQEQANLPEERTLAKRPGLDGLRRPGQLSGGFSTLAGYSAVLDLARMAATREKGTSDGKAPSSAASILNAIPHHGEVPMFYFTKAGPLPPLGLTTVLSTDIPRLAIEDLIAAVMNIALSR